MEGLLYLIFKRLGREDVHWIHLANYRRTLVNTAMKLRDP
jgi:hypothetical protein